MAVRVVLSHAHHHICVSRLAKVFASRIVQTNMDYVCEEGAERDKFKQHNDESF